MGSNKKVVIVGGDHHNTLSLIRAFGYADYYVVVYIVSHSRKSFVVHSKYVSEYHIVDAEEDVLDALLRFKNPSEKIPVVTASDRSAEVFDLNYDTLSPYYLLANCGEQGMIAKWMNKEIMLKKAEECGLHPPYSLYVTKERPFSVSVSDIPFPCVIKPLRSSNSSKDDFAVCKDGSELTETVKRKTNDYEEFIIQEKVDIDYEFLIIGSRCRRARLNHIVGGLHKTKCCKDTNNMGMLVEAYTTPIIPSCIDVGVISSFLDSIDYEGLYSVEFMISNDKAFFAEINLRNDACLWCWTEAGCNMAVNWVEEVSGCDNVVYNLLARKKMIVEISYLKYYRDNLISMIKDFKQADSFAIFNKRDIKPLLFKFLNVI